MTWMKNAISKALVLLAMLSLAAAVRADNVWNLRIEQGSMIGDQFVSGLYVNGISEQGAAKVWLDQGGTGVNSIRFTIAYDDANLAPTVALNESIIVDPNATKKHTATGGTITVQVSASALPPNLAINAASGELLLATITYDVTDPAAGVGLGAVTMGASTAVNSQGAGVAVKNLTGVTFDPLQQQGGYTGELEGKPVFDESQDGETTYTLSGPDLFPNVKKFNLATMAYDIPVTVKMTAVTIAPQYDVDGTEINYVSFNAGTGVISITPPKYLNNTFPEVVYGHQAGQFVLSEMTVVDVENESVIGEVGAWGTTVTIQPVDTDPVFAGGTVTNGTNLENAALDGTTVGGVFYDYDGTGVSAASILAIGDADYTDGTFTADLAGGAWDATARAYIYNIGYTPGTGYKPGYDTVVHDDAGTVTANVPFELTIKDANDRGATASFANGFTVTDVNQAVAVDTWTVTVDGVAVAAAADVYVDSVVETDLAGSDPDAEDNPVTTAIGWTANDAPIAKPPFFVKGTVYKVKGIVEAKYTNAAYGVDQTAETTEIVLTAKNTAPVANPTDYKKFIQKGTATSADVAITATDADGDELSITDIAFDAAKFASVVPNGLTLTVTIADAYITDDEAEFTDEPVTCYVTDGEDKSEQVTLKVTYRKDPPPVVDDFTFDANGAEASAFAASITAADSDTAVEPSGIASVEWTLLDSEKAPVDAALYELTADFTPSAGAEPATSAITVTPSQDLIAHPAMNGAFYLQAVITDGNGAATTVVSDAITISDTDRLPSVPTDVAIAEDPAAVIAAIEAVTANATAGTDEDGDVTEVAYSWSYKPMGASDFTMIDGANDAILANNVDYFKKGYVLQVSASTSTEPYGAGIAVASSEAVTAEVTVGNTAPLIDSADQDGNALTITDGETTATCEESCTEGEGGFTLTVNALDPDAIDDEISGKVLDSLTWAVELNNAEAGTIEAGETSDLTKTATFTFTPSLHFNTVDVPGDLFATITATDEDGAVATLKVNIVITEVNDAPTATGADAYVLPDERGIEKSTEITVTSLGDQYEDAADTQTIAVGGIAILNPEIFSGEPAAVVDGKTVTVTFTVSEEAELGASAEVTVTLTDDGTTNGAADAKAVDVTFKVFVGASPWYPIISFECADPTTHAGHTVVLKGSDNSEYSITLKGDNYQIMPADYAKAGIEGFADDVDLDVTVYVWSYSEGTTDIVCAETEAEVKPYGEPGEPAATGETELVADENGWVTLPETSFPMAKSYTLEVVDNETGKVVKTIGPVDFAANENGVILPTLVDQKLQLTDAGDYTINAYGTNPNGDGEKAAIATVTVESDSEADLAWPEDGAFLPADGESLSSTSVKFSWPIVSAATSYELRVYDVNGKAVVTKTLYANDYTANLKDGDAATYTWHVIAKAGKKAVSSDEFSFTVVEKMSAGLVITSVAAGADGLEITAECTEEAKGAKINVEWEYFSMQTLKWTNGRTAGVTIDEAMEASLPGVTPAASDFVFIRVLSATGKPLTDWVPYELQ